MTAAGRNAIYKLLEPNYGEYIARGTMYAAWAAGAAYGATKLYEVIAAGDSSGAQQSPGRR